MAKEWSVTLGRQAERFQNLQKYTGITEGKRVLSGHPSAPFTRNTGSEKTKGPFNDREPFWGGKGKNPRRLTIIPSAKKWTYKGLWGGKFHKGKPSRKGCETPKTQHTARGGAHPTLK